MKRRLIALAADRTAALNAAEAALAAENSAEFDSQMEKVQNINGEIEKAQKETAALAAKPKDTVVDSSAVDTTALFRSVSSRLWGMRGALFVCSRIVRPPFTGKVYAGGRTNRNRAPSAAPDSVFIL